MPDFDPITSGNSLMEIEKLFRCKIYCWRTSSVRSKWECYRHSPYIAEYDTIVDVIIDYNNASLSLANVGVVLDVDETFPESIRYKRKRWTIFEATALTKNPELKDSIHNLREKTFEFEKLWGRKSVHIVEAKEFWQKFNLSLQVWSIAEDEHNHVRRLKVFDYPKYPSFIGMF